MEVEEELEVLEEHVKWSRVDDLLVIGGDFNAHVGGGERRRGVCGRFGIRRSNRQGRSLLEWCQRNDLTHVNSYFQQGKRGTWFSNIHKQWYELDGFIMRNDQRQRHVERVHTIGEVALSDHKPKRMVLNLKGKKWRKAYEGKRVPQVNWERLGSEDVALKYSRRMEEEMGKIEDQESRGDSTEWTVLQEVVLKVAEEQCGRKERQVVNPWMVGKDVEVARLKGEVGKWLEQKRVYLERQREGEVGVDEPLAGVEGELKRARKEWKDARKRWEREWWESVLDDCESATGRGDSAGFYRGLRKLESREKKKAPVQTTISTEKFRDHFMAVSQERFENDPVFIEQAVDKSEDLRDLEKTREWRVRLDEPPDEEEVLEQMLKMRDSAPGEDGVRLKYLLKGGPKLMAKVVEVVKFMWTNGAETWEDALKTGVVVPLWKMKGSKEDPTITGAFVCCPWEAGLWRG